MRDFAKVGTAFWTSPTIQSLSDDGKLLALYLSTSPHQNAAGTYRVPDGYVSADLKWPSERVAKGFVELSEKGFATRCTTTDWVVVHKHFKHNPIENPNQAKHVLRLLEDVPRTAEVIPLIRNAITEYADQFPEGFAERFLNALGTVPKQKRERREREEGEGEKGAAAPPDAPHQRIVDLYHQHLPTLRRVEILNDHRKDLIRGRWRQLWEERGKRGRPNDAESLLERFAEIFVAVGKSDFLMGRKPAMGGRPPFSADLEWLMGPQNFVKLIEGKYHEDAA